MLRVSLRYTDVGLPTQFLFIAHCWFNTGQLCTTLAQHHSNTNQTHNSSTPASTAITGRLTNGASMLIQRVWRWPNNNPACCIHWLLCGNCYRGDNFILELTLPSRQNEMKWIGLYRLNWARRTSWGWWDDWDDTVLQTQNSKFEPWRSEAEHATSRSQRLSTILSFTSGWGRNIFVSFKPPRPGTNPEL